MDVLVRNSFCFYVDRDLVPPYRGYYKHHLYLEVDDTSPSGCWRIERANFISGPGQDGVIVEMYFPQSGAKISRNIGDIFHAESEYLEAASFLLVNWGELCVAFPTLAAFYSLNDLYKLLERNALSGPSCDSLFRRDMIFAIVNRTASFEELVDLLNTKNIIGLKKVAIGFGASEKQHFSSGDTIRYFPSDPKTTKYDPLLQLAHYNSKQQYFADPSTAPYYRYFEIHFRFTLPPDIKKMIDGFVPEPVRSAHKMTYHYLPGISFVKYNGYAMRVGNTYAPDKIVAYLFAAVRYYELEKEFIKARISSMLDATISDHQVPYAMFMSPRASGDMQTSYANMAFMFSSYFG